MENLNISIGKKEEDQKLVSVILTGHDYDSIMKQISHFCRQTYRNVEMIFVDHFHESCEADEKRERAKFNNFLKRRNVTTVKYERTYGYAYEPVSCEELFVFGMKQAKGDYVILSKDYVTYNNTFIETAVEKAVKEDADFVYTDLVVSWKEGTASRYFHEILTNGEAPYNEYIKHAGKLFGLDSETNKLIKTELCWKVCDEITGFYVRGNRASAFAGEAVFGAALWARAEKAVYVPEVFSIVDWEAEDKTISDYAGERNTGKVVEEIGAVFQFVHNRCTEAKIDKVQEDTYKADTISRFVWRSGWAVANLKSDLENKYGISVKDYSIMDAFLGRISDIDISEAEAVPQEISELDQDMKIKIFISMHKPSFVPENKYLIPIQVGTAHADKRFENTLHDDEGENISAKNKRYCELTAQYWAWKNDPDADYYGFWHYRRYFCFNTDVKPDVWGNVDIPILTDSLIKKFCLREEDIQAAIKYYDIIISRDWVINEGSGEMTVYQHWCKHFNPNDMQTMVEVIQEKYPEYDKDVMNLLFSNSAPFCNLFIMNKELFREYNEFCFTVLEEVEKRVDHENYNVEKYRTMGHLAERLIGIFIKHLERTRMEISILRLPTLLIRNTKPKALINPITTEKKQVVLTLACNNKFVPYTAVLLESIKEHTNNNFFYDIVLMHVDIPEEEQLKLSSIFFSSKNVSLRFADVSRNFEQHFDLHVDRHLSVETYFRFMILDIMPDYDKVLYLDCDMIVNRDIAELYFTDMGDKSIAATRDFDFIASYQDPVRKKLYDEKIMKYINIFNADEYFQAGVILFNMKKISKMYTVEDLFKKASSRNWYYHDQDVLNSLFAGDVYYLDSKWNVMTLLEPNSERKRLFTDYLYARYAEEYNHARKDIGILHFAGVPKPWYDTKCDLALYFWEYAKRSPYYEQLLSTLNSGYLLPFGNVIFIGNHNAGENVGCEIFDINMPNSVWNECYLTIDFIFLSDHARKELTKSTLFVVASILPGEIGNGQVCIRKFTFDDCEYDYIFRDNISYRIFDNKTIRIMARQTNQYEGFSWRVRELQSRGIEKPTIEILNEGFITNIDRL